MHLDVLLGHELSRGRAANGLRGVEVLVHDAESEPEGELVLFDRVFERLGGVFVKLEIGQLRREGQVARADKHVLVLIEPRAFADAGAVFREFLGNLLEVFVVRPVILFA